MDNNDALSGKPSLNSAAERPEWMKGDDGFAEYLALVEPEIAVELARYREAFPYHPKSCVDPVEDNDAYLYLLITAAFLKDANTVNEWAGYVGDYHSAALTLEQMELPDSPRVKVRAHYLKHALSRLLGIIGAPPAMVADVVSILDLHRPRGADVRAAAQEELCRNPGASAREVAKNLTEARPKGAKKVDHAQISKDLKGGSLVRPVAPDLSDGCWDVG
jgi:hypothetical protein